MFLTQNDEYQLIALGANVASEQGKPAHTLHLALSAVARAGLVIRAVSRFFRTPCFPVGAGPDYVNAAAQVDFDGSAADLLDRLHRIEADFGRERVQRWGARSLDLDLLSFRGAVAPDLPTFQHWQALDPEQQAIAAPDQLILPHPRIADRAFVLVPLNDIAPDWRHPVSKQTVHEMLARRPPSEIGEITPI